RSVTEPDTGASTAALFTVTKTGLSQSDVTVTFKTADGTAKAGLDYSATSGTLTFSGLTSPATALVSVNVSGDLIDEPNENFFVNLSNPTVATITKSQGTATIVDNDPIPT